MAERRGRRFGSAGGAVGAGAAAGPAWRRIAFPCASIKPACAAAAYSRRTCSSNCLSSSLGVLSKCGWLRSFETAIGLVTSTSSFSGKVCPYMKTDSCFSPGTPVNLTFMISGPRLPPALPFQALRGRKKVEMVYVTPAVAPAPVIRMSIVSLVARISGCAVGAEARTTPPAVAAAATDQ